MMVIIMNVCPLHALDQYKISQVPWSQWPQAAILLAIKWFKVPTKFRILSNIGFREISSALLKVVHHLAKIQTKLSQWQYVSTQHSRLKIIQIFKTNGC